MGVRLKARRVVIDPTGAERILIGDTPLPSGWTVAPRHRRGRPPAPTGAVLRAELEQLPRAELVVRAKHAGVNAAGTSEAIISRIVDAILADTPE